MDVQKMECDKRLAQELFGIIVHDSQVQKIANFRAEVSKEILRTASDFACDACAKKTTGNVCGSEIQQKCVIRNAIEGVYGYYH